MTNGPGGFGAASGSDAWTPGTGIALWRFAGLLLLAALWLSGRSGVAGVVLLLFLAIMAAARWRLALPGWTVLLDQAACLACTAAWPEAWYALALPAFEAALAGRLWLALPAASVLLLSDRPALISLAVLAQGALGGWAMRAWSVQLTASRREADRARRDRYELEHLKTELLQANVDAARLAALTERGRIAAELHDHAGHELTAAALALQAFDQLRKEGDPRADDLFGQAERRLASGTAYMRETVRAMIPATPVGADLLEEVCRDFAACPIRFHRFGDTARIPAYQWTILEACLKEALTNVARHADADRVDVSLDVGPHIVRLDVHDDGAAGPIGRSEGEAANEGGGIGLRNLRRRARAVGGSLSVDRSEGFKLVCVLPLEPEETEREGL
ncbi:MULTISPECIES: sensor histidine kinase [Cohnella]|uniref:sensor histidine kinase n=1 Tax=Cohnella TaxID=329857 RepID=UPI0009B94E18|nr:MULTISPECIES: histidine kinase [Cohnella]MBN2980181.1 sensor histidine kinase [Cohnella algarum]